MWRGTPQQEMSTLQQNGMRVHVFDVEHGECNAIETPSGDLVLVGVGHNSTKNWRPSDWLCRRNQRPSCIVLSNLDRDHLSDLPSFEPHLRPNVIQRNTNVTPEWVRALKIAQSGEVHNSIETALQWMENVFTVFTGSPISANLGMETKFFYHSPETFQDTNNLSVVTFVCHNGCGILFPGDLETAGWKEFLKNFDFLDCLRRTSILIASHHGRESGYCEEVFNYCSPHAVIISDKPVSHDTQNHSLYQPHCSGLNFSGVTRKVLTTRSDGKMTIDVPASGNYTVCIQQSY